MSEEKGITIEVNEAPVESSKPEITIDEARESGLSAAEVADAKRFGMVVDSSEEPKTDDKKTEPPVDEKREPANSDIRELVDQELDPEKEADAVKDFQPNEKALYWKFKKEKRQRQRLEEEVKTLREKATSGDKTNAVVEELRREIAALKAGKAGSDEAGSVEEIDEDTPLTMRQLKEIERKRTEQFKQQQEENQRRAEAARSKMVHFEEKARDRYEDFDRVLELSTELVKNGDKLLPDGHPHRKKAEAIYNRLRYAMENPEQFSDDYGVGDIAYELGELHPQFKSTNAPDSASSSGKQDPGLSPEQMERLKKSRPPVSASVSGGAGKRVVSEDDITPAMVENMSQKQWAKLSERTKNRLLGAPQ